MWFGQPPYVESVARLPLPAIPNALRTRGRSYATAQPPENVAALGTAGAPTPNSVNATRLHVARFSATRHCEEYTAGISDARTAALLQGAAGNAGSGACAVSPGDNVSRAAGCSRAEQDKAAKATEMKAAASDVRRDSSTRHLTPFFTLLFTLFFTLSRPALTANILRRPCTLRLCNTHSRPTQGTAQVPPRPRGYQCAQSVANQRQSWKCSSRSRALR